MRGIFGHAGFTPSSVNGDMTYPADTLVAYQQAVLAGAIGIQPAIQTTSDGKIVCYHDETVNAITDGTGTVSALTWSYLSGLDAGYRYGTAGDYPFRAKGYTIPLFSDVLAEFKNKPVWIFANICFATIASVEAIVQLVRDAGMFRQVIFSVGSVTYANLVKKYNKNAFIIVWGDALGSAFFPFVYDNVAQGVDVVCVSPNTVTQVKVDMLHALGFKVMAAAATGTVAQQIAKVQNCLSLGCDMVSVDNPTACVPYFSNQVPPVLGYDVNRRGYDY